MLSPMDHVTLVRPADVDGMLAVLQERVGDRSGSYDRPARHEFQRRTCVAQIAEVLDSVLGRAVPAVTPRWEAAASPDR